MVSLTNRAAKAAADAIADEADVGTTDSGADLVFYDGTEPADADTALSGNTLLASVELQDPAFGAATDANPGAQTALLGIPLSDNDIDTSGTCTFARLQDRDNDVVAQYTVGATGSGEDIEVNSVTLVAGATFEITAFNPKMPES